MKYILYRISEILYSKKRAFYFLPVVAALFAADCDWLIGRDDEGIN